MAELLNYEGIKEFYDNIINAPIVEDYDYLLGTDNDKIVRIGKVDAEVGDICFYDSEKNEKVIVPFDDWNANKDKYSTDRYTPIGVVVIPSSHDVYGTGECAVISLRYMDVDSPDDGNTHGRLMTIVMGQNGQDIGLPELSEVVYTGTCSSPGDGTIIGTQNCALLPSDNLTGTVCPTDPEAYYYDSTSDSDYSAPSPYLEDGSRNPAYYQTESSSLSTNCLSDFDGVGNTSTLLELATAQSDWKTASTIKSNSDSGYSPAACCCWRYHTDGTSQGDWYLPSCGELGYVAIRLKTINNTLNALINTYGNNNVCEIITDVTAEGERDIYPLWSSSLSNGGSPTFRYISGFDGTIGRTGNSFDSGTARAYLRV